MKFFFILEKVAVKIMDRTKMDAKAQRLLDREIKSMEHMNHPNIIRLFECVETLTRTHLVVEYAAGGELYAFVHERGKLTDADAKPLFAQIVAAISHMHKNNLVHRDIKPENIMFTEPGIVKLVDFGFSCMIPSATQQLTTFCGSPPYAAPELFRYLRNLFLSDNSDWCFDRQLTVISPLIISILQGSFTLPMYLDHSSRILIENMLSMDPYKRPKIEDVKVSFVVWSVMNTYGITEEMFDELNERGPRNAMIGTYRIVQHQVQAVSNQSVSGFFHKLVNE
ncbi:unnamed protein product [Angiostrongylus costaricensis]|uniref:Protein kinase domain-containing protein n=1 Tax=Angiostrongylus costaricensis TaxID=334426 RepID=A0A0R3PBS5_ANGCS|nr:unnamed protein product [Angiostrongylus costaricensis]